MCFKQLCCTITVLLTKQNITFVSAKKDGLVIFVSFRDVCKAVLAAAAIMEVTQGEVLGLLEGEQVE